MVWRSTADFPGGKTGGLAATRWAAEERGLQGAGIFTAGGTSSGSDVPRLTSFFDEKNWVNFIMTEPCSPEPWNHG